MRVPASMVRFISSAAIAACALASSACDPCKQPDPPACAPATFGLTSAQPENLEIYPAPAGCSLAPTERTISDEQSFQDQLRCTPTTTNRGSGIDFQNHKLFIVVVTAIGRPTLSFGVRDRAGVHVGAFKSVGCSGAAPVDSAVGLLVAPADNVIVHACQDGAACNACQPPPP